MNANNTCSKCKKMTKHYIVNAGLRVEEWVVYHLLCCNECDNESERTDHPLKIDVKNGETYFLVEKRKPIKT